MTRRGRAGGIACLAGLALSACWGTPPAHAQRAPEPAVSARLAFYQANEQYRKERYAVAVDGYRSLLKTGVADGVLYYNLGNALLKSGSTGEALWAYRKAVALMPRDADVASNLEYTESLLSDGQAVSVTRPRLVRWLTWNGRCTTGELAMGLALLIWLTVLGRILGTWIPRLGAVCRPLARVAGLGALLVLTAVLTQVAWLHLVPRAVVVEGAEARFSPQETGTTHFALPEGTVVRLVQRQLGWVQVRRGDGRAGWVDERAVKDL